MLAAHMDQIGLMVTHIDAKGFLRFAPVGFIFSPASWGAQVHFADGTVASVGLDGRFDWRHEVPALRDMFLDVGATSRDQVKQQVGDVAGVLAGLRGPGRHLVLAQPGRSGRMRRTGPTAERGSRARQSLTICTRCLPRRKRWARAGPPPRPTPSSRMWPSLWMSPTPAIYRTPRRPWRSTWAVGSRSSIQDSGMISHPGLNRQLIAAAEADGIPYQLEVLQGGTTDAYAMQASRAGACRRLRSHFPAATSTPRRRSSTAVMWRPPCGCCGPSWGGVLSSRN